jgi:hypothetical protein
VNAGVFDAQYVERFEWWVPMPEPAASKSARLQHRFNRWLYRGGRPGRLAQVMNRMWAALFSTGLIMPNRVATLEVPGRRTGRIISFPVVIAHHDGDRYLVSMLGNDANWPRTSVPPTAARCCVTGRREATPQRVNVLATEDR